MSKPIKSTNKPGRPPAEGSPGTAPAAGAAWLAPAAPPVAVPRRHINAPTSTDRIVAVIAPAGYGKTTLAAQWFDACQRGTDAYWFALDASWRDPAFFVDTLMQAITHAHPSTGDARLDGVAALEARLSVGLEAMRNRPRRVMLFFDDVHVISQADSGSVLSRLLLAAPSNVGFVLTGRDAEGFGLSRLAMRGEVRWVSERQLVLSPQDVRDVAQRRHITLTENGLQQIVGLTEGWPALVQLALCGVDDGAKSAAEPDTRSPLVNDYIYESFFRSLSPPQRVALSVMAAVPDFTPALLDTLGCTEPVAVIASCERLGLVQHRRHGASDEPLYALHPLVSEEALRRFRPVGTQALHDLRRLAARWWWDAGDADRAIRLALLAGDDAQVLQYLLLYAPVLVQLEGRHETFLSILDQIQQRVTEVGTEIELHAVWSLIFLRRYPQAEQGLQRIVQRMAPLPADAQKRTVMHTMLLQRAVMAGLRDDHVQAGINAQQWLTHAEDTEAFRRGTAHTVLAFSQKCASLFDEARASLAQARVHFATAKSSFGTGWVWVVSTLALVKAGQHRAALTEATAALADLALMGNGMGGLAAMLHAARALLLYERDLRSEAQAEVEVALPLLEHQGIVDAMIAGYVAAARLQSARGDVSGALDVLAEGERVGAARGFERLRLTLVAERALQLLRADNPWGARQLVEQHGLLDPGCQASVQRDKAERFGARFELAQGRADRARKLADAGIARARGSGQLYKLAELLMLSARAAQQMGDMARADAALDESLNIAAAQGFMRLYLDEGPDMLELLRRAAANPAIAAASSSHANTLIGRSTAAQQPVGPAESGADRLTERELQILRMIAEGHSNADLAARIFLTEGTVKWHLHNLYRKLNVNNRTGAMREARTRGLLLP
jgi:LuxR family transcriptional regulator, maltose regulon positive regulatory protein